MKTIVHVNQHRIRSNIKAEKKEPVLTTKTYKENKYSNTVQIVDDTGKVIAELVYSPDKPLSCGARVWLQADSKNIIVGE